MPCLQTHRSSPSLLDSRCPDFLTPEFVKFSMELTNSELLSAAPALSGSLEPALAPHYVLHMQLQGEEPRVKAEDTNWSIPQTSEEMLSCCAGAARNGLWEDTSCLHLQADYVKTYLPRLSLWSVKEADTCFLQSDSKLRVAVGFPHAHHSRALRVDALCAVCGDSAACQHYGVRTCEGCKGFFKRTVQKNARYVCVANRSCPVDKRRRNRCQYCRFQKCLDVGMLKEVVRRDSLKGRRGRLPSKAHSPQDSCLLRSLIRAYEESSPVPSCSDPQLEECGSVEDDAQQVKLFYSLLTSSMDVLQNWAHKIPGYASLPQHDQDLLFYSAFLELFVLRVAYRSSPAEEKLQFCDGSVRSRLQCVRGFGPWLDGVLEFSLRLRRMDLDTGAFSCVCALALLTDRPGLKEPEKVKVLQRNVRQCLKDSSARTDGDQRHLLDRLPDLASLCTQGLQRIFYLKLEDLVPPPASIDKLFLDTLPF